MRKILIAALILAGGCDATRRDFSYCSATYTECNKGFACNQSTGKCELIPDGSTDAPWTGPDSQQVDGEIADAALGPEAGKDSPVGEAGPADVALPGDGPVVDTSAETGKVDTITGKQDAPGTCGTSDSDCTDPVLPFCVKSVCVACKVPTDCKNPSKPFCSAENKCEPCAEAPVGFCSGKTPACDPSGGCVECVGNGDCKSPVYRFCVANTCQGCNAPGASAGNNGGTDGGTSSDAGGIDGGVLPACVGAKPVCATTGTLIDQCVECEKNADCKNPSLPICTNNACTKCTSDSQCTTGPGICMYHQDGRCATEAETIYVQNSSSCSGGSGTVTSPYCKPQDGMSAAGTTKALVVITGATPLAPWSASFTGTQQISVIGRQQATVSAGAADIGIRIVKGNVYLRGLTVQGAGSAAVRPTQPGVLVEAGATLTMDRCNVYAFAGGLLISTGANFDISNSVFANNFSGQYGTMVFFGGVLLGGSAPKAGPSRFWYNTVAQNDDRGIICADAAQTVSGVLANANSNGDYASCVMDKTSVWGSGAIAPDKTTSYSGDLSLDSTYHLKSTNFCKDRIALGTPSPQIDMDGQSRPRGGGLDCGADEY